MGTQYQSRRGTSTQMLSFTGADGEIVVDTTYSRPIIHNSSIAGGFPVGMATLAIVNNANYTSTGRDCVILYTVNTVAHSVTLPSAAAYPLGQRLRIQDGAGTAAASNITVNTSSSAQRINGSTGFVINANFGGVTLFTQGSTQWVGWST